MYDEIPSFEFADEPGEDGSHVQYLEGVCHRTQERIAPEYRRHGSLSTIDVGGVFSVTDGSRGRVLKLMDTHFASGCDPDFIPGHTTPSDEGSLSGDAEGRGLSGVAIQVVDQKVYDVHIFGGKKAHEILGIGEDASLPEARKQYLRLTNLFHPDRPWKRRGPEFDTLLDRLKEIGFRDQNNDAPWLVSWADPGFENDGGGYMILYYNFIQKIIDNKITYDDQSEKSKKDRAYKAERAISLMNEYIGFLGGKFYQVCKAYELFEQGFGSLNIVGSYLTWTHHYRIPIDLYENNIIEGSVIELPGTHAKIFVPIRWIVCTEKSIDKLEEKSFLIEDFDNARLTEALLTFDISVEDNIFTPGRVFSRPHIPFECRIFDIVGILEWYGDRQFSQAYIQALKSRFPDIENPERVLTSYLDGEITADSLQSEYGGDLYSIGESIDQRGSYGIERTEIGEVLFFQNNTTLRLSREDIEILRYIALNLNLIRQSILIQLGLTS